MSKLKANDRIRIRSLISPFYGKYGIVIDQVLNTDGNISVGILLDNGLKGSMLLEDLELVKKQNNIEPKKIEIGTKIKDASDEILFVTKIDVFTTQVHLQAETVNGAQRDIILGDLFNIQIEVLD